METIRMIDVSNLPLTSRLCFTLWGYSNSKKASSSRLALVCYFYCFLFGAILFFLTDLSFFLFLFTKGP